MRTILITGASGFIGSELCNKLISLNENVIALGVDDENIVNCKNFYKCGLNDELIETFPNIDVCFHLAANNDTQSLDVKEIMKINYYQSMNLFKTLLNKGCKKFIYSSSCAVYGNQTTPFTEETKTECLTYYAQSKLLFESFAKNFSRENDVCCVGLRYSNVYGKKEAHKGKRASMIHQIVNKFLHKNNISLFKDGNQKRDWVYVDDVVQANILSLRASESDIFNIGYGASYSFNQIIQTINKITGLEVKVDYIDCKFASSYQKNTTLDVSKAKNILNYCPKYSLEEGIMNLLQP